MGSATIQIPFKDLVIVIDVRFELLTGSVPSLLCLRDLCKDGLDISVSRRKVTCGGYEQDLAMFDYFLVHNWQPSDVP